MYFWHIPLFFFLSGVGFLSQHSFLKTIRHVIVDILLYLWVWTVIYGVVLWALDPLMPEANFVFANEPWLSVMSVYIITFNSHAIGFLAPCWFLLAYAAVVVICAPVMRVVPRYLLTPLGVLALVAGWQLGTVDGLALGAWRRVLVGQSLLGAGYCLLGAAFFSSAKAQALATRPVTAMVSLLAIVWVLSAIQPKPLNIAWLALDPNILAVCVVTFAGIHLALVLARSLQNFAPLRVLGRESKAIMTHHLLGFALINVCVLALGRIKLDGLHAYSLFRPEVMWPAYLVVGLLLPLGIVRVSSRLSGPLRL